MVSEKIVKDYLGLVRVSKHEFDELVNVAQSLKSDDIKKVTKVFDWFRLLRSVEIEGWRTKVMTGKIAQLIFKGLSGKEVCFYALFCPSYKKGDGAFGFRIDNVGTTTETGLKNLINMTRTNESMGIKCASPLALFFDIAVEQAEKVLSNNCLGDLEININNFRNKLPKGVDFRKISQFLPEVFAEVGYRGVIRTPLPIPDETFARIVERGRKFYELFGWSEDKILERSKIIGTSEAIVGEELRNKIPNGIMVYTPTMLERAAVYSGVRYKTDPLPIIFPKKDVDTWDKIPMGS